MSPFVLSKETPYFYTPGLRQAFQGVAAPTFDFATYNMHFGKHPEELARTILSHPRLSTCDIIAIQEIEALEREKTPRIEIIARRCGFYCVYAPARNEKRQGSRATHGLAILSKHPLSDIDVFELPRYELGPKTRRRICVTAKANIGGEQVRIYNAHLDTRITAAERIAQLEPIVRDAKRYPDERVIIAGDINTIPSLRFQRSSLPLWRLGQRVVIDAYMRENGYAFPSLGRKEYTMRSGIKMMLDAVYAKNLSIQDSAIEYDIKSSDHFPLVARIGIK